MTITSRPGSAPLPKRVPFSCFSVASQLPKCVECFCQDGPLHVRWIRGGNAFREVALMDMTVGVERKLPTMIGSPWVDAAVFNTPRLFVPFWMGRVSRSCPLSVVFRLHPHHSAYRGSSDQLLGRPLPELPPLPFLHLTFFGSPEEDDPADEGEFVPSAELVSELERRFYRAECGLRPSPLASMDAGVLEAELARRGGSVDAPTGELAVALDEVKKRCRPPSSLPSLPYS